MKEEFDTLVIGPVSLDRNIDCEGNERREVGGAIVASGYASAKSGNKTALFTKCNSHDVNVTDFFADCGAEVYFKESKETTSIQNQYLTPDQEKRICTGIGKCDAFLLEEMPEVTTKIYHFAGLMYGDFDGSLFEALSKKGKVAVDVQCLLRHLENDKSMKFHDYEKKNEYFKFIDFLKTDAAEAEILTGTTDRREAAKMLFAMGAKEVFISHNTELLAYDGKDFYTCPIKARNLSGRTGRGDTCFAGYITERLREDIPTSLQYSTALVSLKMEKPGPFKGTRQDVLDYIDLLY